MSVRTTIAEPIPESSTTYISLTLTDIDGVTPLANADSILISLTLTLYNAIMTDNAEFEATDDGNLAPRLILQARWDPAAPTTCPWLIEKIGATA